jgi:hypothetical protein
MEFFGIFPAYLWLQIHLHVIPYMTIRHNINTGTTLKKKVKNSNHYIKRYACTGVGSSIQTPHLLRSGPSLVSCPEIQSITLFRPWNVVYWQFYFLHWKPSKFHGWYKCIKYHGFLNGEGGQFMSQTSLYILLEKKIGVVPRKFSTQRWTSMIWIHMWHLHFMDEIKL